MGSMVHLALGPFEVDWGESNSLRLHGEACQPGDVTLRLSQLPALPELTQFRTAGANGAGAADINSRAAAIECYFDLAFGRRRQPKISRTRQPVETANEINNHYMLVSSLPWR